MLQQIMTLCWVHGRLGGAPARRDRVYTKTYRAQLCADPRFRTHKLTTEFAHMTSFGTP